MKGEKPSPFYRVGFKRCQLTLGPLDGSSVELDFLRGVLVPTLRLMALDGAERLFAAAATASLRAVFSFPIAMRQDLGLPFLLVLPGEDGSEAASSARFLTSALLRPDHLQTTASSPPN